MTRKPARENLEIRVVRAGKSWRVDVCEIGAQTSRTASRARNRSAAVFTAIDLAAAMRNLDIYGYVRVMAEI